VRGVVVMINLPTRIRHLTPRVCTVGGGDNSGDDEMMYNDWCFVTGDGGALMRPIVALRTRIGVCL
jgi:hypothetical protein